MRLHVECSGLGESDFYRTRLTHSVEVAQIANGIKRYIESNCLPKEIEEIVPETSLVTAIALAHDIGHPPFGHGGEVALNYMMRGQGGFEGNAQSLRILERLEARTKKCGLDLTRRSLLGLLKYPVPFDKVVSKDQRSCATSEDYKKSADTYRRIRAEEWKPPKCYYSNDNDVIRWILKPFSDSDQNKFSEIAEPSNDNHGKPKHKSFDTTIMDLADDISYGVHDLEDAIHIGFIRKDNNGIEKILDIIDRCNVPSSWLYRFDLIKIAEDLFQKKNGKGRMQ